MSSEQRPSGSIFACSDTNSGLELILPEARTALKVERIDIITEPGMDGILAGYKHIRFEEGLLESMVCALRLWANLEHTMNGSKAALIIGHADCKWVKGTRPRHRDVLTRAKAVVESWEIFEDVHIGYVDSHHRLHVLS
ncbi:MAG TPA: carbonic anhydrase [Candidatus Paceibacterota bacterium]|nr:carbonic anhydrase [Candidatus Paceibacterota bacterium]